MTDTVLSPKTFVKNIFCFKSWTNGWALEEDPFKKQEKVKFLNECKRLMEFEISFWVNSSCFNDKESQDRIYLLRNELPYCTDLINKLNV